MVVALQKEGVEIMPGQLFIGWQESKIIYEKRQRGRGRARERYKKAYLQGISKFLSSMSDDIMRVHCYQIFNLKSVPIHAEFSSFPCLTSEHACGSNLECENKRFGFQPATRIECCLPLTREMRHARNCCSLTQLFFFS